MAFSFLDEENIFELYDQAKEHTDKLTEPYPEYARIANNKPHPKVPKRFPKTTDGTTAAIIEKTPKRVIQQMPEGVVESGKSNSKWPVILNYKLREEILPNANLNYDLIQKCWNTLESGMTFGSQLVYTPMISNTGKLLPNFDTIYWGDLAVPKGKKSGYAMNYMFVESWWQKSDAEELIASEEERIAEATANKEGYKPTWDLEALREILEACEAKDDKSTTPSEEELSLDPSGIRIVTGFQVGRGSIFYTFNPTRKLIVRRKQNTDIRGKMPLDWYYYDVDGSNPLGRGMVRLVGPMQNLIDGDMQAYQYNRGLALQPTINVFGNHNTKMLSFGPNAINRIPDPNVRIEAQAVDTSAIREYPNIFGLQKSQLMNLTVGDPATAISAEVGDPMAGKTPTAIKSRNQSTSVDDNAIRKGFEAFFENWAETALNLYVGERKGVHELDFDDETSAKLRELGEQVSEDNILLVDFDEITEPIKFKVNASTSKVNSEAAQLESLQVLVTTLDSSQSLSQVVPTDKKLGVWNAIVANSAIEGADKLKVSEEELEAMQMAEQQMMAQQQVVEGMPEGEVSEELPPEEEIIEPSIEVDPMDEAIATELRGLGIPEDLIAEVPVMVEKGYTDDEIMTSIQGVLSQMEVANE